MFSMLLFAHVFDTAICLCLNTAICATLSTFICSYVAKTLNFEISMVKNVITRIVGIAVYLEKKCTRVFMYYMTRDWSTRSARAKRQC